MNYRPIRSTWLFILAAYIAVAIAFYLAVR